MKKIVVLIVVISCLTITSVFANDCNLVISGNFNGKVNNYQSFEYKQIIPEMALTQVLINLKAYCCTRVEASLCSPEEKMTLPKGNFPESAYIFDHLLDVTMRRLDGIQKLAYGLQPDPTGKERRDYITSVANDPTGKQASEIEKKYTEYRTIHDEYTKHIDEVAKKYTEYNSATFSLGDKYNTLCWLMKNIYESLQKNTTIIWGPFENNSFYSKCKSLVVYRVSRENAYVKLLMIKKSTQLLDETTKKYTKKYFVEEKLMALWSLILKVKDTFKTIIQQAATTKSCSQ